MYEDTRSDGNQKSQDYEAPTKNKVADRPNAPTEVSDAFGSANMADISYGVSSYGGGRAAEQKLSLIHI